MAEPLKVGDRVKPSKVFLDLFPLAAKDVMSMAGEVVSIDRLSGGDLAAVRYGRTLETWDVANLEKLPDWTSPGKVDTKLRLVRAVPVVSPDLLGSHRTAIQPDFLA